MGSFYRFFSGESKPVEEEMEVDRRFSRLLSEQSSALRLSAYFSELRRLCLSGEYNCPCGSWQRTTLLAGAGSGILCDHE